MSGGEPRPSVLGKALLLLLITRLLPALCRSNAQAQWPVRRRGAEAGRSVGAPLIP